MTTDTFVFISCIWGFSLWAFYTVGYEKGVEQGTKQCPPISQKMLLHSITENSGGISCRYQGKLP